MSPSPSRRRLAAAATVPAIAWVAAVLSVGLLTAAWAMPREELAWFAAVPGALVLAAWWGRSPAWDATLDEAGLEQEDPPLRVPFHAVVALEVPEHGVRRGRGFPVRLHGDAGTITIPAAVDEGSRPLFEQLLARIGIGGRRDLGADLARHQDAMERTFGSGQVVCFGGRRRSVPQRKRRLRRYGVCLALGAAIALAGGFQNTSTGLAASATVTFFLGLLVFAAGFHERMGGPPRRVETCGLVVSPAGIALRQGDVSGELRFGELEDDPRPHPRRRGFPATLALRVAGADIVLFDVYDRPLEVIARVIECCRSGRWPCPACAADLGGRGGTTCGSCGAAVCPPPSLAPAATR